MTWYLVAGWIWLTVLACLFVFAADGGRVRRNRLDRHANSQKHKRQMQKAALCVEAASHWSDLLVTERFVAQAFRLCDTCGCPVDLWPAPLVQLHVGVMR